MLSAVVVDLNLADAVQNVSLLANAQAQGDGLHRAQDDLGTREYLVFVDGDAVHHTSITIHEFVSDTATREAVTTNPFTRLAGSESEDQPEHVLTWNPPNANVSSDSARHANSAIVVHNNYVPLSQDAGTTVGTIEESFARQPGSSINLSTYDAPAVNGASPVSTSSPSVRSAREQESTSWATSVDAVFAELAGDVRAEESGSNVTTEPVRIASIPIASYDLIHDALRVGSETRLDATALTADRLTPNQLSGPSRPVAVTAPALANSHTLPDLHTAVMDSVDRLVTEVSGDNIDRERFGLHTQVLVRLGRGLSGAVSQSSLSNFLSTLESILVNPEAATPIRVGRVVVRTRILRQRTGTNVVDVAVTKPERRAGSTYTIDTGTLQVASPQEQEPREVTSKPGERTTTTPRPKAPIAQHQPGAASDSATVPGLSSSASIGTTPKQQIDFAPDTAEASTSSNDPPATFADEALGTIGSPLDFLPADLEDTVSRLGSIARPEYAVAPGSPGNDQRLAAVWMDSRLASIDPGTPVPFLSDRPPSRFQISFTIQNLQHTIIPRGPPLDELVASGFDLNRASELRLSLLKHSQAPRSPSVVSSL